MKILSRVIITVCALLNSGIVFSQELDKNTNASLEVRKNFVVKSFDSADPKTPAFSGMDSNFVQQKKSTEDITLYKNKIKQLNLENGNELFVKRPWNIKYYNQINYPVIVDELIEKEKFSSKRNNVGLRFLDLPIYMPDQGWKIPIHLEQFKEVIAKAVEFERVVNPDFEKTHYVYITVDQGEVKPNTTQRRAGWHGDSYRKIDSQKLQTEIPTDNVYVCYDNSPTLFQPGPFPLDGIDVTDVDQVLKRFSEVAKGKEPIIYPNYTLLKMDPYCVHDAGINNTNKTIFRTFVKISFSKSKYCKLGNAHNQLFVYDWPMLPRHNVPYTQDAIRQSAHRKDRDRFKMVNLADIDFSKNRSDIDWAQARIKTIMKVAPVQAEQAQEGEILETNIDGFLTTVNVAQKGDWKVTTAYNDVFFLGDKQFRKTYIEDIPNKGQYIPTGEIRRAVEVTEDIRFNAPWGTLEYAQKGDYLVYVNRNDVYSTPKKSFEHNYKILEE